MTKIIRQGEVRISPITAMPDCATRPVPVTNGAFIVGESESHHHHVLDAEGVTVLERTDRMPSGMKLLYAIVEQTTMLRQTRSDPHAEHIIDPGTYEIRIKREFNPFAEQVRRVAD